MFETVTPTVRYAKAPTAIGVVTHGDRALLIDSGLDENLVRKVIHGLDAEGVSIAAIVNTHAHADHFGGNRFARRRTDCRIVAPAFEHHFIERPELEGWTLFGAPAPDALSGKFLKAPACEVDLAIPEEGVRDIEGFTVRFHSLPGHSVRQMGVEVDGVLFAGDALLPEATLRKYGLVFAVDPAAARESHQRLLDRAPEHVVSYHGGLVDDLLAAVAVNRDANLDVERMIESAIRRAPCTAEDVFTEVCDSLGHPASVELYALNLATTRAYLSHLERAGKVRVAIESNQMIWRTIS